MFVSLLVFSLVENIKEDVSADISVERNVFFSGRFFFCSAHVRMTAVSWRNSSFTSISLAASFSLSILVCTSMDAHRLLVVCFQLDFGSCCTGSQKMHYCRNFVYVHFFVRPQTTKSSVTPTKNNNKLNIGQAEPGLYPSIVARPIAALNIFVNHFYVYLIRNHFGDGTRSTSDGAEMNLYIAV